MAKNAQHSERFSPFRELVLPPNNKLEVLSGDRKEQYSICFVWTESGPDQVEIVDYH